MLDELPVVDPDQSYPRLERAVRSVAAQADLEELLQGLDVGLVGDSLAQWLQAEASQLWTAFTEAGFTAGHDIAKLLIDGTYTEVVVSADPDGPQGLITGPYPRFITRVQNPQVRDLITAAALLEDATVEDGAAATLLAHTTVLLQDVISREILAQGEHLDLLDSDDLEDDQDVPAVFHNGVYGIFGTVDQDANFRGDRIVAMPRKRRGGGSALD